jgi:hypothetical protein
MSAKFYHYLRAVIRTNPEPYDWGGILGFVGIDIHLKHHVFCSALQTLAARGCLYLPRVLPLLAHDISPMMLDFGLSMRPDANEIFQNDPRFIVHISQEMAGN